MECATRCTRKSAGLTLFSGFAQTLSRRRRIRLPSRWRSARSAACLPLAEVLRGFVVVAVDDDAAVRNRLDRCRSAAMQVIAVHEHVLVVVIAHQAHQRRLEVEAPDVAGPGHARLGRADVEAHVGIGDRFLDLALRGGEAADVDDRVVRVMRGGFHESPPKTMSYFASQMSAADEGPDLLPNPWIDEREHCEDQAEPE